MTSSVDASRGTSHDFDVVVSLWRSSPRGDHGGGGREGGGFGFPNDVLEVFEAVAFGCFEEDGVGRWEVEVGWGCWEWGGGVGSGSDRGRGRSFGVGREGSAGGGEGVFDVIWTSSDRGGSENKRVGRVALDEVEEETVEVGIRA